MTSLQFIKEQMTSLGINYEFNEWTSEEVPKLYFVGDEYHEGEMTEDGVVNSTLKIVSHNTGGFKDFFEAISKIKNHFDFRKGAKTETDNGNIFVLYGGHTIIPPKEAGERTKVEIILRIKEKKTL